jgi:hypothetical protein
MKDRRRLSNGEFAPGFRAWQPERAAPDANDADALPEGDGKIISRKR